MSKSDTIQSAKYSRNQPTADSVRSQSLLKRRWQMKTQQPKASTQLKNIKPPGSCSTVQSNRPYHLSFQLPLSAHSILNDRKSMYQSRLLNDRKCTYQPRKVSYSWSNSGVRIFQPHSSRWPFEIWYDVWLGSVSWNRFDARWFLWHHCYTISHFMFLFILSRGWFTSTSYMYVKINALSCSYYEKKYAKPV